MKSTISIIVFWALLNGSNFTAHVLHLAVTPHSATESNLLVVLILVLVLSVVFEVYHFVCFWKDLPNSHFEEIVEVLMILFSAATFTNMLTVQQIEFGLMVFSSLLAKSVFRKRF